jgi:hypothetical protein
VPGVGDERISPPGLWMYTVLTQENLLLGQASRCWSTVEAIYCDKVYCTMKHSKRP